MYGDAFQLQDVCDSTAKGVGRVQGHALVCAGHMVTLPRVWDTCGTSFCVHVWCVFADLPKHSPARGWIEVAWFGTRRCHHYGDGLAEHHLAVPPAPQPPPATPLEDKGEQSQ